MIYKDLVKNMGKWVGRKGSTMIGYITSINTGSGIIFIFYNDTYNSPQVHYVKNISWEYEVIDVPDIDKKQLVMTILKLK